jgi:ubiquinone/menaquinone biosynthesis C-methylase UbiE
MMSNSFETPDLLPQEVLTHYASGYEFQRLQSSGGQIELLRTQELIMRYIPPAPAVIFDVGGGPGVYSCWLAKQSYEVHLVDANPLHVEQAWQTSQEQPGAPLASIEIGDARNLNRPDSSVDVVLLFGPLYHLTERSDRIAALGEARRILCDGGVVLAVAISRFASVLDGMYKGLLEDSAFVQIVERDLTDGQHRNPTNHPMYFTTSFFHHPEELKTEVEESGLRHAKTLAIEGPVWLSQYCKDRWHDKGWREQLLTIMRRIEHEPSLLGVSAHILALAYKAQ